MVKSWEDLKAYTGWEIINKLDGEDEKQIYKYNWEQMKINYGDNIDFQLRCEQVLLCNETHDFLYERFTPAKVKYSKGTRPVLDATVEDICRNCGSEKEKVISLMCFCRDLYKKSEGEQLFYGGTEEELIKKGENLCECLGRLIVALCEAAGIPGRIVMHVAGGHIVSEVYFDGRWAYVDPRCGLFCLHPDGSFASVWELWQNRDLLLNQSDEVKSHISANWTWEQRLFKNYNMYFHDSEIIVFNNYSLMDSDKYNFNWVSPRSAEKNGLFAVNREYRALSDKIFGLQNAQTV